MSDAAHFVFNGAISPARNGQNAVVNYNLGSGSLLAQIRARWHAADMAAGATAGDILIGSSVPRRRTSRATRGHADGVTTRARRPTRSRRHGVGVEPAARLPERHQPEVDHPQLRDPGVQRVCAPAERHAGPGLPGAGLRSLLGGQPHTRAAARFRFLCAAAAGVGAAHGRHPRRQRRARAVPRPLRLAAVRATRARRPTKRT